MSTYTANMTYVTAKAAEQNTPTVKRSSKRRDDKRRLRKQTSGRPGRKSAETRQLQADALNLLRNRCLAFLTEADLPNLTAQKRAVTNVLLQPESDILTNKQIARVAGVCPKTVADFRGSPEYYEALANSDIFESRLMRLEAKAMTGLENNITKYGDNTSIKMVLVMRQRLEEAHRNVFQISADTVQIGIGESLKNLPEAKYEVIAEGTAGSPDLGGDEGSKEPNSTPIDSEQHDNDTEQG